jgi:prepilin-type N-terminal cleavage/methylation domain-containing protein
LIAIDSLDRNLALLQTAGTSTIMPGTGGSHRGQCDGRESDRQSSPGGGVDDSELLGGLQRLGQFPAWYRVLDGCRGRPDQDRDRNNQPLQWHATTGHDGEGHPPVPVTRRSASHARAGFTLVEMLLAMIIFVATASLIYASMRLMEKVHRTTSERRIQPRPVGSQTVPPSCA